MQYAWGRCIQVATRRTSILVDSVSRYQSCNSVTKSTTKNYWHVGHKARGVMLETGGITDFLK